MVGETRVKGTAAKGDRPHAREKRCAAVGGEKTQSVPKKAQDAIHGDVSRRI